MLDFLLSNGPAPAYAVESDSEDDQWDDDLAQPTRASIEPNKPNKGTEKILEWIPNLPQPQFDHQSSTLLVLLGDPGVLVASGIPEKLLSQSEPFNQLDQYLLLSDSLRLVLSSAHVPLELQTTLARKLLSDIKPPSLTIVSSYPAPAYIPPSSDQPPIRYLASNIQSSNEGSMQNLKNLGCVPLQVPNLIKGFEAALMIQASILKIESKIILLPAISRPHDQKSSTSIPIGQYDFSTGLTDHDLPSSLLSIEDPNLRNTIKSVMDQFYLNSFSKLDQKWQFPVKLNPLLKQIFKFKLNHKHDFHQNQVLLNQSSNKDISLMYL